MIPLPYILRLFAVLSLLSKPSVHAWINYPQDGTATLTHYDLPKVETTAPPVPVDLCLPCILRRTTSPRVDVLGNLHTIRLRL